VGSISSAFSRVSSFLVGAIYAIRQESVDRQSDQTQTLNNERRVVQPMFLCFAGFPALLIGYWKLKFCNSGRDLLFGTIGLFIGLPSFSWGVAIFLGIV
jgi:hypothetical protein